MPRTRPILHTWAACGAIIFAMLLVAFAVGRCCDTVMTPKFAYVANQGELFTSPAGTISMYSIETNGALKPLMPATVGGDAGLFFSSLAADPSGRFVYATSSDPNFAGRVSMYKIEATGSLTPNSPETTRAGVFPSSVAVDPLGRFVYVANRGFGEVGSSVSLYKINDGGSLTPIAPGTVDAGRSPNSLAVDPSGSFVYVANQLTNDVSMFQIDNASGVLNPRGAVDAGISPSSVAVDPSGRFVYVANGGVGSPGSVSMYKIGAMGSLTPIAPGTLPAGTSPFSLAIDPFGRFVYVANQDSKDVWIYTIDDTNGLLTMRGRADAGTSLSSVAVDPSGRFVYVTSGSRIAPIALGTVSMYSIDQATGALTSIGTVDAGFQPSSLATVGSSR
jgi:6-phosphogluconolactonase (cycloisomerase 2 family)